MRVALFHNIPSGGAKRAVFEWVRRLAGPHAIEVYSLSTANHDFCDIRPYVRKHKVHQFTPRRLYRTPFGRLNQLQRWRDLLQLESIAREIGKEIEAGKYDVVFAQPCMWTQAPLVLRHLRSASVYYCHEPPRFLYEPPFRAGNKRRGWRHMINYIDPLIHLYRSTARRLDKQAVHAATLVLVNSRFTQDRVKNVYGIDSIISYHGVDTRVFCPQSHGEPNGNVLSVGAIQPHKGYDFLIESLSSLPEGLRPCLRLIGNAETPGEREFLENLAADHGVELCIEVGISQDALVRRYNEAALVVYAPHNEPFGFVPLEAMACGRAVVGVREGGVQETLVHEYTGLLIARDPRQFGEAIRLLLENPALAAEYGSNGRKHVLQNWTWERSVSILTAHLEECVGMAASRIQNGNRGEGT